MIDQVIAAMRQAIRELKQWPQQEIQLFHHNDSDGLSSGAILKKAFGREGYAVRRFSFEKPYPAVLQKIFEQEGRILVFTDFAGRIAPLLSDLNRGRNLVLILDHHVAEAATDPKVHNLDPDLFGIKGDRDITASCACYVFAKTLDPANRDMAHIAAIGAVGDQFFVDGRLAGINREVTLEAVDQGTVSIEAHDHGERYYLINAGGRAPLDELGAYLDTLGAAGFYRDGPRMGVKVCLAGTSPDSDRMVTDLRKIQTRAFAEEIARWRRGDVRLSPRIQWIHVHQRFAPMGVKMIGAFLDEIRDKEYIDPKRFLAGFQIIPNEIPGFGHIDINAAKISMRVSPAMEIDIRSGKIPGLNIFLPQATQRLGGFSDACHTLTAATTVAIGQEEQLIDEMETILKGDDHG